MGVPLSLDCLDCPSPFLPYCVQNPRSFWRLARLRKVTVLRSPLLFDSSRVMCGHGHGDSINRSREGGLDKGAQIPGRTHMTQQGGREKGKGASVDIRYSDTEVKGTDYCGHRRLKIAKNRTLDASSRIRLALYRQIYGVRKVPIFLPRSDAFLPLSVVNFGALNEGLKCEGGCVRP